MIANFKHRGLKRLYERGDKRGINPQRVERLEIILADLDAAGSLQHLRQPGYHLHRLKGSLAQYFAIDVSGNWRITFRFKDGMAFDIDLIDYH